MSRSPYPLLPEDELDERLDRLCQRRCSFALWRLPGEDSAISFCMQEDGWLAPSSVEEAQSHPCFLIAPWERFPLLIRAERKALPAPDDFAPWAPPIPREEAASRSRYHQLFSLYSSWLRSAPGLSKIVLARAKDIPTQGFSIARAFRKACRLNPSALNALIHSPATGDWLCSSPELLLEGKGERWSTVALAGTRSSSSLPWDEKNRREQALVEEHIRQQLTSVAQEVDVEGPFSQPAGPVEHLCSALSFRMKPELLPDLLHSLPPTPAVCGYPVQEARLLMRQHPDVSRGCYAGYLGPVGREETRLYVTLRCMQIFPGFCRLYAGGGLMPESREEDEWEETEVKMRVMSALLP